MSVKDRVKRLERTLAPRAGAFDLSTLSEEELKQIIAPFDFSELSDDELRRLESLARKAEASVGLSVEEVRELELLVAKVKEG